MNTPDQTQVLVSVVVLCMVVQMRAAPSGCGVTQLDTRTVPDAQMSRFSWMVDQNIFDPEGRLVSKYPPKSRKTRLADMTVHPPEEAPYKPPAAHMCEKMVYPVEITPEDQFVMRQWVYRGKVVDFAIMQQTKIDGEWVEVARVDCCHGMIHRHQFVLGSDQDVYDHRPITDIPAGNGWEVVDQGYEPACTLMFNEWDENLRRWRHGS